MGWWEFGLSFLGYRSLICTVLRTRYLLLVSVSSQRPDQRRLFLPYISYRNCGLITFAVSFTESCPCLLPEQARLSRNQERIFILWNPLLSQRSRIRVFAVIFPFTFFTLSSPYVFPVS